MSCRSVTGEAASTANALSNNRDRLECRRTILTRRSDIRRQSDPLFGKLKRRHAGGPWVDGPGNRQAGLRVPRPTLAAQVASHHDAAIGAKTRRHRFTRKRNPGADWRRGSGGPESHCGVRRCRQHAFSVGPKSFSHSGRMRFSAGPSSILAFPTTDGNGQRLRSMV